MIDKYLERSDMYALYVGGEVAAICAVTNEGNNTLELKNIATVPLYQKKDMQSS